MKLDQLLNESIVKAKDGRILSFGKPEYFDCDSMGLTTLEGCPTSITTGYFVCCRNDLTSFKGSPKTIDKYANFASNKISSFEDAPSEIGTYIVLNDNKFTSLENVHKHIKKMNGTFSIRFNPIKSHVLGVFLIQGCTYIELDNLRVEEIVNKHLKQGRDGLIPCQNQLIEEGFEDYAQI